jgi:excisionase family DNA binding protein
MPSLLTLDEAAEILRLSRRTLENWIRQGKLTPIRFGRNVRIERSEVERLLPHWAR